MRIMFSFILFLLMQIQFCYGNMALTTDLTQQEYPLKHYVLSDQIALCEEGVVIFLNNTCLLAQSIFHDENGFYYLEEGVYWICRNCGALNDLDDTLCYRCGRT